MVKYTGTAIGFREVPNEISLLINISNCPHHCEGCHSAYLQEDVGEELTPQILESLLDRYDREITCVCFLGEGNDICALRDLVDICFKRGLLTCLYTGSPDERVDYFINTIPNLNFIKTGPYIAQLGGLDSETTNQRFYEVRWRGDANGEEWWVKEDFTHLFWKK